MKLLTLALVFVASISVAHAGSTGNPYVYTFDGDPTSVSTSIIDPPKGALIYNTVGDVWLKKSSVRGSNAGYDPLLSGTSTQTLVNKTFTAPVITSPAISGVSTLSGTATVSAAVTISPSGALILTGTATPAAAGLVLVTATTMKVYFTGSTGIIISGTGNTTF